MINTHSKKKMGTVHDDNGAPELNFLPLHLSPGTDNDFRETVDAADEAIRSRSNYARSCARGADPSVRMALHADKASILCSPASLM